jgi:hypothetical protein
MGAPNDAGTGFYDDTGCGQGTTFGGGGFGGGVNIVYDNPPGGVPAPENAGIGRSTPTGSACLALHSYNLTDASQLREVWVNLWFIDEAEVTQRPGGVGVVGPLGMSLPPGQSQTYTWEDHPRGSGRIIQLMGERHVWTPRQSVWLNDTLIYDSHDWRESATFNYDSLTMNPPINPEGKTDGAASGPIEFTEDDVIRLSCFVENQSDVTLRFGNELDEAEVCNLWGTTVGGSISGQF